LRYKQFEGALEQGNKDRIKACKSAIVFIKEQKNIVDIFNKIQTNVNFKKRVTHHPSLHFHYRNFFTTMASSDASGCISCLRQD